MTILLAVLLAAAGGRDVQRKHGAEKALREACRDDVGKFCKNTKPGRLAQCLRQYETELAPSCSTALRK